MSAWLVHATPDRAARPTPTPPAAPKSPNASLPMETGHGIPDLPHRPELEASTATDRSFRVPAPPQSSTIVRVGNSLQRALQQPASSLGSLECDRGVPGVALERSVASANPAAFDPAPRPVSATRVDLPGSASTLSEGALEESAETRTGADQSAAPPKSRSPMRVHVEYHTGRAHVWLGIDAPLAGQRQELAAVVAGTIRAQGHELASLTCNGRAMSGPGLSSLVHEAVPGSTDNPTESLPSSHPGEQP